MARYHVNPETGNVGQCSARIKCAFSLAEEDHYPNKEKALKASEQLLNSQYNVLGSKKKFSFLKEFEKVETEFTRKFEGIPTRFFNSDIRKKDVVLYADITLDTLDNDADHLNNSYVNPTKLASNMCSVLSSPNDMTDDPDRIRELAEQSGLDIEKITDTRFLRSLGVDTAWVHHTTYTNSLGREIKTGYIITPTKTGQALERYSVRYNPENLPRHFRLVDTRTLAGLARLTNLTGNNIAHIIETKDNNHWRKAYSSDEKKIIIDSLLKLEGMQLEGRNFKSQKKYVQVNSSGTSARAWEDKKNPKDTHVEAGEKSILRQHFKKIEIDNDVDLEEFKRFEKDFSEVVDRLPKIPNGLEPELKIRKLGRHKANGIFFPHKNVVGIDIRTSGSTIHELAHQYDLIVKNNASLNSDFKNIVDSYSKELVLPPGVPASKAEYYTTPTEILARGFEHYAFEKLGIRNSLIDDSKFVNNDHLPFKNLELKKKMFAFIDNLYKS